MKAGDYAGAMVLAEEILASDPDDAGTLIVLSQIYLTQEKGRPAVDTANHAVDLEPSIADYRLWLARAYLLRASQSTLLSLWYARKGKGQYEKAVDLDPGNVQLRLELCLYYLLAPGIAGGNKDRAREEAGTIEEQSPLFGAYAWASVHERDKDLDRAEERLMQAVEMDTTSTLQARYALGYFYHRNYRLADARVVFEEILAENPDDMNAMYHIGTTYLLEEKELDKAEELFDVYLESELKPDQPTYAMAHWRLGMVYELKGENDLAVAHFEKAVEINPENKEFRAALEAARKE
jgi:tetratricopeptide (TPR) repeat protein